MDIKLLSVIVPAYKEESTIKRDLRSIHNVLKSTPYTFEIICVVDGKELDKTFERAKSLGWPELKVVGYKNNYGKGQAVRFGMKRAKGDIITFIDSGGDIKPQGIIMLLEHMKWYGADIIIGSKLHSASRVRYPFKRRIFTYGYYIFVKTLFGLKVRDTQTGLKAYRREVLEKVLDRLVVKRFAFDIEILAVARKFGFTKIYDAPVEVDFDFSKTSIAGLFRSNGIWNFVKDTLAVWYRMYILKYYDDGRKRKRVFVKDLGMYVATGSMSGKRQVLIESVEKLFSLFGKKKTS